MKLRHLRLRDWLVLPHYILDKIFDRPNLKEGLLYKKVRKSTDYIHDELGGYVSKTPRFQGIDLKQFRPEGEQQNINFERMHCVSEGETNEINQTINGFIWLVNNGQADDEVKEIVNIFKIFGFIENDKCKSSARFVAKKSGTTIRGNSPDKVADTIRNIGLVPEKLCPFDVPTNWRDYYNLNFGTIGEAELTKLASKLLDYIEFKHEWVSQKDFEATNKYGSKATNGYAWEEPVNGIIPRSDNSRNHEFVYDNSVTGQYREVLDSYNPFDKKLAWNYDFGTGKLFTILLKQKLPNLADKFVEDYDGKNVKYDGNRAIWFIQQGKKKLYPSWLAYLAFDGLDRGYTVVERALIENTPDGNIMDVKKSNYWPFLEKVKEDNQLDVLVEILASKNLTYLSPRA